MNVIETIPKLIRASIEKDQSSVEVISLTISNIIKKKYPEISAEIEQILFDKNIGNSAYRSIGLSDIPRTKSSDENFIRIIEPSDIEPPILSNENEKQLDIFLQEQEKKLELLELNLKPINKILIFGEPGVGKTYSATWLASKLNKPLVTLDLATIMSSYLGETGNNIRKTLNYAKENDCVLFLDEFDAIAKTRTDSRELGEIKRIVNVLLKELEDWPINSILIAATNHDEILDKAIWRRFDLKINLNMPDNNAILNILNRNFASLNVNNNLIELLCSSLQGESCAEVVQTCTEIKRAYVLFNKSFDEIIIEKCSNYILKLNKKEKSAIVKTLSNSKMPVSDIFKLTGIPTSTIYKYINS